MAAQSTRSRHRVGWGKSCLGPPRCGAGSCPDMQGRTRPRRPPPSAFARARAQPVPNIGNSAGLRLTAKLAHHRGSRRVCARRSRVSAPRMFARESCRLQMHSWTRLDLSVGGGQRLDRVEVLRILFERHLQRHSSLTSPPGARMAEKMVARRRLPCRCAGLSWRRFLPPRSCAECGAQPAPRE